MTTIRAAGILFRTPDKLALFVQRSGEGDHAGEWCLPGGKLEGDETPAEAARREANEEVGKHPVGELLRLTRTRSFVSDVNAISLPPGSEVAVPAATMGSTAEAAPPLVPAVDAPDTVVDFTTYIQEVEKPFAVKLDPEHTAFTWAPLDTPPQPLHPGVATSVARLDMDELDIAEAIRDGRLISGQRFHGFTLWAMRITGTGVAFRRGRKEFVFRKPELYLNERFLRRCNGLPVIMEHTDKGENLNSDQYKERNCGSVFLPYIVGDEVWAIVKIYDNTANKMLESGQLSTSPSVVFRDPSATNTRLLLPEDNSVILVEGEPSLLDHLAICLKGVWDKGGEPRGIAYETIGDSDMTDEEKKALEAAEAKKKSDAEAEEKAKKDAEEAAKKDAEAGEKLDKVLTCLDSLTTRMDAWDEKATKDRKDAEEAEAEQKRKDGDKEQEAKDKKDADEKAEKDRKDAEEKVKMDADERAKKDKATQDAIDAVASRLPQVMSDEDLNALADAQSRADGIFSLFGKSAPRPLSGESLFQYRRRNATALKTYSDAYKDVDLSSIADDENGAKLFKTVEDGIYKDAEVTGRNPTDIPVDVLRSHRRADDTGRLVTSFQGRPGAWMGQFAGHRRRLQGVRNA